MAVKSWETTATPSSDPQPCSRGRKARVPLKLGPQKARRKEGRREGGPERISLRQGEAGCSSYI